MDIKRQNGRHRHSMVLPVPTALHIDFVSDVACPWCAVGLASLQQALKSSPANEQVRQSLKNVESMA